jgi:hypothetical protein
MSPAPTVATTATGTTGTMVPAAAIAPAAIAPSRADAVTAAPSAIVESVRLVKASHIVILAIITDADAGHCAGRYRAERCCTERRCTDS